jgi:uncharacterized membrane protein YfcA
MDGVPLDLTIFLIATFAGALVAGLSGFAFGLVAASVWLYILTPLQTATLIIAFGLIVQGYSVWKLRHALDWRKLWPFLVGAAIGVPVGVTILTWANPAHVRAGIGVFLVLYSLYGLFRPAMNPITAGGAAADAGVGFLNGILAGITGLAGILVRPTRLAKGPTTRCIPAGGGCHLRHECRLARSQGRRLGRHDSTIPVRTPGAVRRHLARYEALRPS